VSFLSFVIVHRGCNKKKGLGSSPILMKIRGWAAFLGIESCKQRTCAGIFVEYLCYYMPESLFEEHVW